jgi:hypothetical protein
MKLTRSQKRWAVGGSIGAGVIFLGYELFRHLSQRSDQAPRQLHQAYGQHKAYRHDESAGSARGEYGRQKRHHHKGHQHG